MSKSKNYNSIVFLTTLSVYLGLVLSGGATPSVLAHSALTLDFDLKNEIVFEEDLDKKPDDENCSDLEKIAEEHLKSLNLDLGVSTRLSEIVNAFVRATHYALEQKGQKEASGETERKFSGQDKSFCKQLEGTLSPCDNLFDFIFPSFHREEGKSKLVESIQVSELETIVKFNFNFDSLEHSQSFASAYNSDLKLSLCKSKNTPLKVIYENTKAITENNQVLIVTRLPRASIDSLIAQKDAR